MCIDANFTRNNIEKCLNEAGDLAPMLNFIPVKPANHPMLNMKLDNAHAIVTSIVL